MPEGQVPLDKMKRTLTTYLVLLAPQKREPLLLYIAMTPQVVSVVLVVKRSQPGHICKVHCPVYFVSEVLCETKA